MTSDGIRLFILIAKHNNITHAAREIGISQSTASRHLKRFEEGLRMKLFKKNGQGRTLTQSGRTLLAEVLPISLQLEALEAKYTPSRDSLVVAASQRPSKYLLPALMTEFGKKHPSALLTLRTRSSVEIEKLLLASKVDLAITTNPTLSASSFATEPYCREPLTAFVSADHPLARMKSLRPAEMGAIAVIIKFRREGESRVEAQLRKFEKEGIKFKIVMRCESPEVVKEFVRDGAGVGFLYYSSIRRGIERGEFTALRFPGLDLTGQNYIVYSKEQPLSRLAREFLSHLRASVAKSPPEKVDAVISNQRRSGQSRAPAPRPGTEAR